MDAVFKKYLALGETPKKIIKISFRNAGDYYFPCDEDLSLPTYFMKVFYSEPLTNYVLDVTDRMSDYDLGSIPNLHPSTYINFGFSQKFYAVKFRSRTYNRTVTNLAWQCLTSDGTWDLINTTDGTSVGGAPFAQDGIIEIVDDSALADWAKTSLHGHKYYWLRFTPLLQLTGAIAECRVKNIDTEYYVHNNCVLSIGNRNIQFNLEPENYGETIPNLAFTLDSKQPIIKQLLYSENWKSCHMQLIEYFDSYVTRRSEVVDIGSTTFDISYDFGNTEQNVQFIPHRGIITEHPMTTESGVPVQTESLKSYWDRQIIPRYEITENHWPRCPQANLGRRGPIVVSDGSEGTTPKEIICVDEGASAILVEDHDAETTTIKCIDLQFWGRAASRQWLIIVVGREKMFVSSVDMVQNTMEVVRGYANTLAETHIEGSIVYEYRPQETHIIAYRDIPTGQLDSDGSAQIIAVNPDDDREQYQIPKSWFQTFDNSTNYTSNGLTYIKTIRPLKGYFGSTLNDQLYMKTSQGTNNYPTQTVEPLPALTTLSDDVICRTWPSKSERIIIEKTPDSPTILINEGWTNPNAIFDDSPFTATFQGLPQWNISGKKYATLLFDQPNIWSQSGSFDILGIGGSGYVNDLKLTVHLYGVNVTNPPYSEEFYFHRIWDVDNNPPPIATKVWRTWPTEPGDIAYLGFETYPFDGRLIKAWLHNDTFSWSELQVKFGLYVTQAFSGDMSQGDSDNWINALCYPLKLTYKFDLKTFLWTEDSYSPNFIDGNDATYESANGIWTIDFHPEPYHCYWDLGFEIDKPSGGIAIDTAKLRIVYDCDLNESNTDEEYYIEWDPFGYHGGPFIIDLKSSNNSSPLEIEVPFSVANWIYQNLYVHTSLFKHDAAPVKLYNIQFFVSYYDDVTSTDDPWLWTDDEDFWAGQLCGSLQSDGPQSFAWLQYMIDSGNYFDKDGVISCPVSTSDIDFGLVEKVYLVISSYMNQYDQDTDMGGCVHKVGDDIFKAAWAWFGYANSRAGQWTGTSGQVNIGAKLFQDDNATLATWGIGPGWAIYYRYDDNGNDPPNNQGTYIIKWLGNSEVAPDETNETQCIVDEIETQKWDMNKTTWTGWTESASGIKYKIFKPHELQQLGEQITEEFDITNERPDWDADLDFYEVPIKIRSHLYTDKTEDYYNSPNNPSFCAAWMPKLRLIYNDGREAILCVKWLQGINSGDNNPISANKLLAQNEAGIDSDYFDDDSWTSVEEGNEDAEGNAIKKIDYHIKGQSTWKEVTTNMSFYFGWYPSWAGELITAKDGRSPRLLDGVVLTQEQGVLAYGTRTQWDDDHDLSEPGQAAGHADYGHESDATTGWTSSTGCSIASVEDPRTGSSGSYAIRVTSSGTESDYKLTLTTPLRRDEDVRLDIYIKCSASTTITYGLESRSLRTGNYSMDLGDVRTISTDYKKLRVVIPKDVTKNVTALYIQATDIALNDTYTIDDILLRKQVVTAETPQRDILISNPIQISDMGSVGKWGPLFTEYSIRYRILPWTTTKTLTVSGGDSALTLSSQGSQVFSQLQSDYGIESLASSRSNLFMISDKATALAYCSWLQRFSSERFHSTGMVLGQVGRQLEIGDCIFLGMIYHFPQHYQNETYVWKYMQVIAVDTSGTVDLIEISDYFTNTLI